MGNTGDLNVIINTETFTLRDVFAGLAMHAALASRGDGEFVHVDEAAFCYNLADAMLKEREKTQGKQS